MVGSGAVAVILLSLVMFIASFFAGTVPLAMSLSQERMKLVSSLGVGLLVGTSLGVVLPEGIEMLYNSMDSKQLGGHTRLIRNTETAIPGAILHPGHVVRQGSEHIDRSPHLVIALSLVAGYLIMHLLTFLPPLLLSSDDQSLIPLSSLPSSPTLERVPSGSSPFVPTGLSNTTIGLCIHALADGIALGSSAVSDNLALEGIVFLAIMLHKVYTLCIQT
jgi:zinc transporter 9